MAKIASMAKKGFSMIELTIVLAIVGLVVGGIYVGITAALDNSNQKKLYAQFNYMALNMRKTYGQTGLPPGSGANGEINIDRLIRDQVVPPDAIKKNSRQIESPYGPITVWNVAGNPRYRIIFSRLPQDVCKTFVRQIAGSGTLINNFGFEKFTGSVTYDIPYTSALNNGFSKAQIDALCGSSRITLSIFLYLYI